MSTETRQPTALSLFSGCGGFCEGIKLAGFQVVGAVEQDRYACESYRFNFPEVELFEGRVEDFVELERGTLVRDYGLGKVDLVFGGPPCQGYSQIGTRDLADPRNSLYKEFIRVLQRYRPPAFLMENVPNMLLLRKGLYKDAAIAAFRAIGYDPVSIHIVDSSDYGVPQQRRRVFFFGLRADLEFPFSAEDFVRGALESLKTAKKTTVWEAIGDLPAEVVDSGCSVEYPELPRNPSAFLCEMRLGTSGKIYSKRRKVTAGIRELGKDLLFNHHTKEIQARRLSLIKLLKPGDKASALPKEVWDGKRPEKWRRLHSDRPSHTLLAQMHRDLSEFVHPRLDRWISVREALRLQSFHDGFVTRTSEWQQLKQIGNAVPPLLGRVVGLATRQVLDVARGDSDETPVNLQRLLFAAS